MVRKYINYLFTLTHGFNDDQTLGIALSSFSEENIFFCGNMYE